MLSRTPRTARAIALTLAAGAASAQPVTQPVELDVYATGLSFDAGTPDTWDASMPLAISTIAGSDDILLVSRFNFFGATNTGLWTLDPDSGAATPVFLPEVLQPGIPNGGNYWSPEIGSNRHGDIAVLVRDLLTDTDYIWRRLHDGSTSVLSDASTTLADTGDPMLFDDGITAVLDDGTVAFVGQTPGTPSHLFPRPALVWQPNGEVRTLFGDSSPVDALPSGAQLNSAEAFPLDDDTWLVRAAYDVPGLSPGHRPLLLLREGRAAETVFLFDGPVPGLPSSEVIIGFTFLGAAQGHAYFETRSTNGRNVVWTVDTDGNATQILRENRSAPVPQAGAKYNEFIALHRPLENGDLLFRATLTVVPSEADEAVFVYRAAQGSVQLVVQDGESVTGFDPFELTSQTRASWGPNGEIWLRQSLGDDRIVRRWRGPASEPQMLFARSVPIDLDPDPAAEQPFAVSDLEMFSTDDAVFARLEACCNSSPDNYALVRITVPTACVADANNDGLLTPADFNAWILAYTTQSDACDQNDDGLCNPGDFNAWVLNFNAGC